ncbi:MAG: thiamine-binding protein [Desulfomonilaceae bacterium]
MIASFSVYPISEGTSLSRFVKKGVAVVKASGYPYEVGAMSTAVEVPDLDALFELVKKGACRSRGRRCQADRHRPQSG